ncbi:MAG: carbohydrate ABC transporter permease [Planctomycetota bacterium]|jgi:multiple sugar transport system permease protein
MSRRRSDFLPACLFLGPNFVGFAVFVAFPVAFSIVMAFTNWDLSLHNRFRDEAVRWVWLENFVELAGSGDFWKYLGNTLFLMMGIPLSIAGSLFLAVILTRPLRGGTRGVRRRLAAVSLAVSASLGALFWVLGFGPVAMGRWLSAGGVLALGFATGSVVYRTVFYLPHFTSGVAVYLLWKQMYNPLRGPVNAALEPALAATARVVTATGAWLWLGLGTLLWVAAILGVVWLIVRLIVSLIDGDTGFGSFLLGVGLAVAAGLIAFGLRTVLLNLPGWSAEGLAAPTWLNDVHWAKPAIMIMGLWAAVGSNNMLLYIAGISNIPPELYEAAEVDGAAGWGRFRHVTWPQLAPTTFFIVIMAFIGGLQGGFEVARTMTGGGPFGATTTLSYFVYSQGFEAGRLGYASAVAWVMFAMIFTLTVLNYRFGSRYIND